MKRERKRFGLLTGTLLFLCLTVLLCAFVWPWQQEAVPETEKESITMYAVCQVAPVDLAYLKSDVPGAEALCDGDESTLFCTENAASVTVDLRERRMLSGVRFLPSEGEKEQDIDRSMGTIFSVSNDGRNFQRIAVAEPLNATGYEEAWQEYGFDGLGAFRYVRVEIPAHAPICEIQWLMYPDWQYRAAGGGKTTWQVALHIEGVKTQKDAYVIASVYNHSGTMKGIYVTEQTLMPNTPHTTELVLTYPNHAPGDSYRIQLRDKNGRTLAEPLFYTYRQGTAAFSMPNLFSNDMMLQAQKPVTIWGKAPKGSMVRVRLYDGIHQEVQREIAVKEEDWSIDLGSFPHGGSYTLEVTCGKEQRTYENVTFGDVWLLIGQSNMEYHLLAGKDTEQYLRSNKGKQEAENPQIRLLNLWMKGAGGSGFAVSNLPLAPHFPAWSAMNKEAAGYCSAIGYFFATQINQTYGLPVGLVSVAVGDTEINRWLPYGQTFGSFTSTDGSLYNNRILPLSKLNIKGILMYQGEADQYRTHLSAEEYRDALCGLVDHYRSIWGEDLPFYWTQLTRYHQDESAIREGQRLALSAIANPENAGVVSLMDIYGEYKETAGNCRVDIHPHQKKTVAERFFLFAKRDVYGEKDTVAKGPVYLSLERADNQLILTFATTGDLSVMPLEQYADKKGQKWVKKQKLDTSVPQAFELAGEDGVFYPAKARLMGNKVVLESEKVSRPVQARYAWGAYPEMPNLTDQSGLPALSFMTEKVTIF